jgi:hypothetical protein
MNGEGYGGGTALLKPVFQNFPELRIKMKKIPKLRIKPGTF